MMRSNLLILLFFTTFAFAGEFPPDKKTHKKPIEFHGSGHHFVDLGYGYCLMNVTRFNNFVDSSSTKFTPFRTIYSLGGNYAAGGFATSSQVDVHVSFNYFVPQILTRTNGSTHSLGGYNVVVSAGRDLMSRHWLDILPYAGLGFGSLRYKINGEPAFALPKNKYSNPVWLINLGFMTRLNLKMDSWGKGVSLGIRAGYWLDFSSSKWETKFAQILSVPRSKMFGPYAVGVLSFWIPRKAIQENKAKRREFQRT